MSARWHHWRAAARRLARSRLVRLPVTCDECGRRNDPGVARFCGRCGSRVAAFGHHGDPAATRPASRADRGRLREVVTAVAVTALLVGVLAGTAWLRRPQAQPLGAAPRGDAGRSGIIATITPGAPEDVAWQVGLGEALPRLPTAVAILPDVTLVRAAHRLLVYGTARGELRWVLDDPFAPAPVEPVQTDQQVVIIDETGATRAYDPHSGERRWEASLPPSTRLTPAGDGALAVASGDQVTWLGPDGPAWSLSTRVAYDAGLEAVVGAAEGVAVVVGSRPPSIGFRPDADGFHAVLLGIDLADGSLVFDRPLALDELRGAGTFLVPPMSGDTVVLRTADPGRLRLVDIPTAGTREIDLRTVFEPALLAVSDGELFVWTRGDGISAHELSSGRLRWRTGTEVSGTGVSSAPQDIVVSEDAVALLFPSYARLYDRATGSPGADVELPEDRWIDAASATVVTADGAAGLRSSAVDGTQHWRAELPGQLLPAAALADGELFVPLRDGLTVRSITDGEQRFAHELAARDADVVELSTPVIGDETIVVAPDGAGSNDRGLFAIDRQTAVLRWDRTGDQPAPRGPLTMTDDGLVFLSVGDEVHAHDLATGRRPFAAVAGQRRGTVAITAGVVVAATDPGTARTMRADRRRRDVVQNPSVIGIDRGDRSTRFELDAAACSAPAASATIAVVATVGEVLGIDVVDGRIAWRTAVPVWCDDLAIAGGVVLAPTVDGIVALGLADGARRWQASLSATIATMPVVAGEVVIVGATDRSLAAFRVDDGTLAWRIRLPGVAASAPSVGEGRLAVRLRDGRLVGLQLP